MKNLFTLFAIVISAIFMAQAPNLLSYQAVVRNAANQLVINQNVGIKFSILKSSATGAVVYAETQNSTTNSNGLFTTNIGSGTVISGSMASINWANDVYFIKSEIDLAGGSNYTITGTQQLLSVPYALNAKNGIPNGGTANQVLAKVDGTDYNTQWVTPSAGGSGASVQLVANKVGGTGETLPLAGSTSPTTIVFNNIVNAPSLGTYNNSTGVFTVGASGAGTYLIQVKLITNDHPTTATNTPPVFVTLIKNNATYGTNGADVLYGDYPMLQNVLPANMKGQGSLTKVVQLAARDTFRIVAVTANSSTAAQPIATVAGSNITIIKL
jgi:hypothetical protein